MKLNNHVHNRLKKRYLKKHRGRMICRLRSINMQPSYKYYQLIKIFESNPVVEDDVSRFLKRRLRIRGTMPCREIDRNEYGETMLDEDFTGDLIYDFLWSEAEGGLEYWKRMEDWLSKHYPEFYSS
ncbi:hypothetical protein BJD49_gp001 [Acinetobacter phage vB_AbaM_phiAbaA1]|uniref:hypothetical protein n=1 Tax=Acinetobacter phage vB_AbaM_phiAbaA1 TaxID=1605379 RepID=UPI00078E58EE|nr:hypothetical protein BJD49_gp001 [Acinetobacter phage vB_AbaM_phiAbaA1]AJK27104.1 hypothetical protein phiAbaA1_001 [Acinetobacter phage vB_AbaM_phiAbaA1]